MKVYELMSRLAEYPAGSEVKIHLIKNNDEMPVFDEDNDAREINCVVNSVESYDNDDTVCLSD